MTNGQPFQESRTSRRQSNKAGATPARVRWQRVVKARVETLVRTMPDAARGNPDAMHDARVASRRAREVLALVAAVRPNRRVKKAMRKTRRLTRMLGPIREFDAGLALLADLAARRHELSGSLQSARSALSDGRRTRAEGLTRMDDRFRRQVERRLRRAIVTAELVDVDWRPPAADQVQRRCRQLLRAITRSGRAYAPGRLHATRIAVKRLRYSVELAAQLSGTRATAVLAPLRRIQEVLGRLHDLEVLREQLGRMDGDARFERVREVLESDGRAAHAEYLRLRSSLRQAARRSAQLFRRRTRAAAKLN